MRRLELGVELAHECGVHPQHPPPSAQLDRGELLDLRRVGRHGRRGYPEISCPVNRLSPRRKVATRARATLVREPRRAARRRSRPLGGSPALISSAAHARARWRALAARVAALLALAAPAAAPIPRSGATSTRGRARRPERAERARAAARPARALRPGHRSTPRTGTPRAVASSTASSPARSARERGRRRARLRARPRAASSGSTAATSTPSGSPAARRAGGVEHLAWEQRYRGIPSADAQLQAAVTASGRLLSVTGAPAPDLEVRVDRAGRERGARLRGGRAAREGRGVAPRRGGAERVTTFADGGRAALALYQDGDGARLGWRVLAPVTSSERLRRDRRRADRRGRAPQQPRRLRHAARCSLRTRATRARPTCRSARGCRPERRRSTDRSPTPSSIRPTRATRQPRAARRGRGLGLGRQAGASSARRRARAARPPRRAHGTPTRRARGWPTATRARRSSSTSSTPSTTTRAAVRSASTGSASDDPVLAQAMDGAEPTLDPTRTTQQRELPDAARRRARASPGVPVLERRPPLRRYDGDERRSLVFHEYTHGLSNRLVTDAQGFGALNTEQAGAIGEGTSDFYALDYLVARG